MYPKKLVLKLEHFGSHATVLHLNITINNGERSAKLYDKHDEFSFFIVRMPNFHCIIRSSITRMEKQVGNMGKLIKTNFQGI